MNFSIKAGNPELDAGMRAYLTSIYNWMFLGLVVSASAAYSAQTFGVTAFLKEHSILFWLIVLAPLGIIFYMVRNMNGARNTVASLACAFIALTACEGLSLSLLLERYTGGDAVVAFLITASVFCGMSILGYTTKIDLTRMGRFVLMTLIGLLVAMVIGIFVGSDLLNTLISVAAVIVFSALVSYDTQVMRGSYRHGDDETNSRWVIWHALDLYLDFVNIFIHILRLRG